MSEYTQHGDLWIPDSLFERERADGILEICARFMDQEDVEYIAVLDEQETIDYLYGRLLDMGEDPDEILAQYGVIEGGNR